MRHGAGALAGRRSTAAWIAGLLAIVVAGALAIVVAGALAIVVAGALAIVHYSGARAGAGRQPRPGHRDGRPFPARNRFSPGRDGQRRERAGGGSLCRYGRRHRKSGAGKAGAGAPGTGKTSPGVPGAGKSGPAAPGREAKPGKPSPAAPPTPSGGAGQETAPAYFHTLPPGATLPTDAQCAQWVRESPQPENKAANERDNQITGQHVSAHFFSAGDSPQANELLARRIDGNFTRKATPSSGRAP